MRPAHTRGAGAIEARLSARELRAGDLPQRVRESLPFEVAEGSLSIEVDSAPLRDVEVAPGWATENAG